MMMRRFVLALALATVPGFAVAADNVGCGDYSLKGGEKGVGVVDNPPTGESIGDTRAGWRKLLDEAGKEIAEVHFVATLTAPETADHGDVLTAQYVVRFADGWLATQSLYELANAADTGQGAGDAVLVVTGGTGPFAGAGGTVAIVAGDPPTYVFDVRCAK